jgi:3-oxoacyl-[acyl-carrier-protein] synthase II
MSADKEIVVTGMGVLAAAGSSPEALWRSVVRGNSPAAHYADPAVPGSPTIPACVVPGPADETIRQRRSHKLDRCVQLALEAAIQAHASADLNARAIAPTSVGVVAGTSRGPMAAWSDSIERLHNGRRALPPSLAASGTLASLSGSISVALKAAGPCLTVSATCASAACAIAVAAQQLILGEADVMIAGGADAPLHNALISQILATGILGSHNDPRQACRPFDVTRNGTLIGEGAAFLVLETLESARRRGVPVHARLAGWAYGSDATHRASPKDDGEGLLHVMRRCLQVAGLSPDHIDYVNAHGTGTLKNDRIEALALRSLLGSRSQTVPLSSTKPVTGHCLGASAALEAVITVLALRDQLAPPTANCHTLDPDCSLKVVTGDARPTRIRVAMSNSLGFWGKNASLIFTEAEPL